MKNQIPFKNYQDAISWLSQFNINLLPENKNKNWEVKYVEYYILLHF